MADMICPECDSRLGVRDDEFYGDYLYCKTCGWDERVGKSEHIPDEFFKKGE